MRAVVRAVVLIVVCVVLAAPASAKQIVYYRGTTSAPRFHRVDVRVIKQGDGDRFITGMLMLFKVTCEDLTTQRWGVSFGGRIRVQEDGTFGVGLSGPGVYWSVDGVLLWGKGSGTTKLNVASLTADGQDAQLCTTGDLTWTVDRVIETVGGAPRSTWLPEARLREAQRAAWRHRSREACRAVGISAPSCPRRRLVSHHGAASRHAAHRSHPVGHERRRRWLAARG